MKKRNKGRILHIFGRKRYQNTGVGLEEKVEQIVEESAQQIAGEDVGMKRMAGKEGMESKRYGKVLVHKRVLDEFRKNVGLFPAETGGMLASTGDENVIDLCHFDTHSKNTPGTFYYDVESMSEVFRGWKAKGYVTNGIYHSHPQGVIRPSYHDISSALLHIKFFKLDYFYLPIFQPDRKGLYTMYFYVVRKKEEKLAVSLDYVIEATKSGYDYIPFFAWKKEYSIEELEGYRESIDKPKKEKERRENGREKGAAAAQERVVATQERVAAGKATTVTEPGIAGADQRVAPKASEGTVSAKSAHTITYNPTGREEIEDKKRDVSVDQYFSKVSGLYSEKVLDKVIVCVGTGGARSFLENMARSGFHNFILMDADVVSPTNVATQGVFISEMGKKKVEVIRDRIKDINPLAKVVCVDRFLDDDMSDEEFKEYMNMFPGKKPTDYLVLGCTDNFEAQKRSSLLALKYGNPYLAAMMYEGGAAAEIIFVYPGVTESCPRCLLRDRFEKYENGFRNDVDSSACTIFATERMNALKGYIALMLLMYREDPANQFSTMLDEVKDRNFVEIRLHPHLKDTKLGIGLFDRVFAGASRYTYMDETIWVPQHPDREEFGTENCRLCGGGGNLKLLAYRWARTDTRTIRFDKAMDKVSGAKTAAQMRAEHYAHAAQVGVSLPMAAGSFNAKV